MSDEDTPRSVTQERSSSDSEDAQSQTNDEKEQWESPDFKQLSPSQRDTITMGVTIDAAGMDERDIEIFTALARLYERSFREVVAKNRDYGWSFLRTGCKLAATDGTPFENPVRSQVHGLLTRTGDKRERVVENVYGDGASEVSDDPSTTAQECGNYWLLLSFVLQYPELASSFLDGSADGHDE